MGAGKAGCAEFSNRNQPEEAGTDIHKSRSVKDDPNYDRHLHSDIIRLGYGRHCLSSRLIVPSFGLMRLLTNSKNSIFASADSEKLTMEGHVDGENGEACPTTTSDSSTATAPLEGMESRIIFSSPVPTEDIVELDAVQRWTAHWQKIKSTTYQSLLAHSPTTLL